MPRKPLRETMGKPTGSLSHFGGAGFVFNHRSYRCEDTFPAKVTQKGNSVPVVVDLFSHSVDCAYLSYKLGSFFCLSQQACFACLVMTLNKGQGEEFL